MKTRTVFSCTLFMLLSFGTFVIAQQPNHSSLREIKNYRTMFRVNQEPLDMVESTKFMCAAPTSLYGPHYDPGVVYYINDIARKGLNKTSDKIVFPIGSIIVKEKQERKTEDSVQIITVMRKVLPESSEDSWEFKMYEAKKWVEIHSSTDSCIRCHRRYKNNDFVSDKGMELLRKN